IQIHKNGFSENKLIQKVIPNPEQVEELLRNNADLKFYSKRVITFGLLSSASGSAGVYINGVIPEDEQKITIIQKSLIKGKYFSERRREVVIGEKLSEKLNVGIGDKVVAMSNTPDGSIGSDVYRVCGIFKSPSSEFDKAFIYIDIKDAQRMLEISDGFHEFVVLMDEDRTVNDVKEAIIKKLSNQYEVLSYEDLNPVLVQYLALYDEMMMIINLIVALALIFGIINVMLMTVFERIREFGVLKSIGMKNSRLFYMIILESFFIGIFGTIIGTIAGLLIHYPLSLSGIDFSVFAKSLDSFGIGAVIYPIISIENLISIVILIPFISVFGAIYPAIKAIKLEPINAIRYV
ncbi:MAG: FtsX-like permease family protein, partial [bacterium]